KVKIQETTNKKQAGDKYIIDISNRDKEYLNKLYNSNGTLKTPTQGDVSGVNYVFPYYSSQSGKFELQVFQRIIGLYEADMLGYVVTLLNFEGDNFKPIYTFVGIV
ncbi:MAG: VCBS repeat-containing protein, partial [Clostridia bacterium]